jgi:molybdopterin converting factor small subunit
MAILRLFANLREIAGTSRLEVEGSTVGEVLAAAEDRFGQTFAAGAAAAAIWRNGESAGLDDPIESDDEVALIPPVSGGEATTGVTVDVSSLAALVAGAVLVIAHATGSPAWWAAALVGVGGFWVLDVAAMTATRNRPLPVIAILGGVTAAAVAAQVMGPAGWGLSLFLAVAAALTWGVARPPYRGLPAIATGVQVALGGSLAVGSLVLTRQQFDGTAVTVFLVVAAAAILAGAALERFPVAFLDPFTGTALAAVVGAVAGAIALSADVVGYLLVGFGLAVSLVAGRGFGSLVRAGRVTLTAKAPGVLSSLDGALLGAAVYFPLLTMVL